MKNFTIIKVVLFSWVISFLVGCGGPQHVVLQDTFWKTPKQKITIACKKPVEPELHVEGSQGLLDIAVVRIANGSFIKSMKAMDLKWYHEIPHSFSERLKQNHMLVTIYPGVLGQTKKSNLNVLAETGGDLLLTVELKALGARRAYSLGMIPSGAPGGYCVLVGTLIDPRNKNKVLWQHEADFVQKVEGKWDQPPEFPNFNAALAVAISEAKQELIDSFFSGR